ncbi:hypothetical protein [Cereibacter sediminicola]|uniref:hypothetical protein n=1 Tax=Cereibacter sediminicola TaxID=2584941 RepID=UPI00119F1CAA|nr:hypothetical protein [Cereibacter sediminicola]
MTHIHDGEKPAFRLGWPFFVRAARQPSANLKTPKILTREELKELFSSELSQSGTERRERPLGMRQGGRFPA